MAKLLISLLIFINCAHADNLKVAVTASFKPVLDEIAPLFFEKTGYQLSLSSASTGVLTQQIVNGAPFDLFFAADSDRPAFIVETLALPPDSQRPYAFGKLVLVSGSGQYKTAEDLRGYAERLVIASPDHAPYGVAAIEVLDRIEFNGDLVMANNVAQARQYLELKLAPAGLIAASVAAGFEYVYDIDPKMYGRIEHHLVVLKRSKAQVALLEFFSSDSVKKILSRYGYDPVG